MVENLSYVPQSETLEILEQETLICEGFESRVTSPEKPLVHPHEGVHLRVSPNEDLSPYFDENCPIENTLLPFLTAMAAARSVFGDPADSDEYHYFEQWVNVHLVPRFGGCNKFQIEVIGRSARGDTWAQPVGYPKSEEYEQSPVVREEQEMIKKMMPSMLNEIAQEAKDVTLFDGQSEKESHDLAIFHFQNFEIMMAKKNPHVEEGGLHLWVHANNGGSHEGVQSDVKNGVEQFILAEAISKVIYKELGVPIEIHFSGNWGLPTWQQQFEAVANGKDPGKNYYGENLSAHANLYGAPPETDRVDLPPRPVYERPTMPDATREKVKQALADYMPAILDNYTGKKLTEIVM